MHSESIPRRLSQFLPVGEASATRVWIKRELALGTVFAVSSAN